MMIVSFVAEDAETNTKVPPLSMLEQRREATNFSSYKLIFHIIIHLSQVLPLIQHINLSQAHYI